MISCFDRSTKRQTRRASSYLHHRLQQPRVGNEKVRYRVTLTSSWKTSMPLIYPFSLLSSPLIFHTIPPFHMNSKSVMDAMTTTLEFSMTMRKENTPRGFLSQMPHPKAAREYWCKNNAIFIFKALREGLLIDCHVLEVGKPVSLLILVLIIR